ncbi:hypothetical protein HDU96_009337 [Phlyctochytrium bullatum]|nr:hypothetical protein HDU96_009337 [Phlyctochytrium bullatum]
MPVCTTEVKNMTDVQTISTFLTDGTTASIALTVTEVVEYFRTQSVPTSVMAQLMTAMMPPGMMNAILYWTSSDLIGVDPSLQDVGVETLKKAPPTSYCETGAKTAF